MLFQPGRVMSTPGALRALAQEGVAAGDLLIRHLTGDWGDIDAEDWETNDDSVKNGTRILSSYKLKSHTIWIITEADRSVTTFLLPSEY